MAKKVEAIRIESMNQAQSNEFHTTNIARAEADPKIAELLAPQLSAWKQANTEFDTYMKQEQRQLLSEDIKNLDEVQDDDLTALKGMVRALQNIPDPVKKESARRVKLCVDNYKIENDWEYIKQMNYVRQMLDDLQGRYAADVAALGLGIFVEKLAASNAAVRQAQIEREDNNAGAVKGQTVAWRRETEKKYRDFVEMLNARSLVFGDADYAAFIDKLNASIAHYRQILAVAAGIRAAKKDEEEEGGNSGSSSSGNSSSNNDVTPVPSGGQQPADGGQQGGGDDSGQQGGGDDGGQQGGGGETPVNPDPVNPDPDQGGGGGGDPVGPDTD